MGGGGKAEGCEASRWSKTYLFVYVIDKRGYVSNFSQIKCKLREKLQFSPFGWGRGELKPSDAAETNFSVNFMYIGTHMQKLK